MKRRCLLFMAVLILAASVVACSWEPSGNGTAKEVVPSTPPEPLPTIKVYEPPYQTSRTVTWMFDYFSGAFGGIKEQTAKEINRILYERGLDCQILFVNAGLIDQGSRLEEQMDIYEKGQGRKYGRLDIVCSGSSGYLENGKRSFLERRFAPLNDLIDSAAGKALRDFYTQEEWKQVTLDGTIYVIPAAAYYSGEDENYNMVYNAVCNGLSLSVNENYVKYFDGFDGTYDSLRSIYNTIGDSNLHILIDDFGREVTYGLLGYYDLYDFPYQPKTKTVVDLTKTDELPNLLLQLYNDMATGILVPEYKQETMSGDVLAHIHHAVTLPPEGFREYRLAGLINGLNVNCRYGIAANSGKKDLAFEILTLCSTDPEILGLLYPGLQKETVERRRELLSAIPEDELTGIYLTETGKKYASITSSLEEGEKNHDLAYNQMVSGMFIQTPEDPHALNPRWNIDSVWEIFTEHAGRYSEVYKVLNQEIQDWLSGK